jgi:hypothetical protein
MKASRPVRKQCLRIFRLNILMVRSKMHYRIMVEADIVKVIPLYINYYNTHHHSCWTTETAYKRIHQVWRIEDSYCVILEHDQELIGLRWVISSSMMICLLMT